MPIAVIGGLMILYRINRDRQARPQPGNAWREQSVRDRP
jgi:hypothetical protein